MEADCSEVTSHGHHPLALSPDALSVGAYLLVFEVFFAMSKKALLGANVRHSGDFRVDGLRKNEWSVGI